jgi:hypothetical protein
VGGGRPPPCTPPEPLPDESFESCDIECLCRADADGGGPPTGVSAAAETLWTARTSISSAMMLLQEFDEDDERREEEEEGVGFENESERGGERERGTCQVEVICVIDRKCR